MGRQADLAKVLLDPVGLGLRQQPARRRKVEGERHAERYRLAVQQPVGEARRRLEGMAEGVPQVEQRAVGQAFVAPDVDAADVRAFLVEKLAAQ